jgi:hypothetical protein
MIILILAILLSFCFGCEGEEVEVQDKEIERRPNVSPILNAHTKKNKDIWLIKFRYLNKILV